MGAKPGTDPVSKVSRVLHSQSLDERIRHRFPILERQVYVVPKEIDDEVARLKLESMGVEIDSLTAEQEKYLASWDEGT